MLTNNTKDNVQNSDNEIIGFKIDIDQIDDDILHLLTSQPLEIDLLVYMLPEIPVTASKLERLMNLESLLNFYIIEIVKDEQTLTVSKKDFVNQQMVIFSKQVLKTHFNQISVNPDLVREEVYDEWLELGNQHFTNKTLKFFQISITYLRNYAFKVVLFNEACPKFSEAQFFFEQKTLTEFQWKSKEALTVLQEQLNTQTLVSYKDSRKIALARSFHNVAEKAKQRAKKLRQNVFKIVGFKFGNKAKLKRAKEQVSEVDLQRDELEHLTVSLNDTLYKEQVNDKFSSQKYIEDIQREIQEKQEILQILKQFGFNTETFRMDRVDGKQSVAIDFWKLQHTHRQCYKMKQILTSLPRYKHPHWKVNFRLPIFNFFKNLHYISSPKFFLTPL